MKHRAIAICGLIGSGKSQVGSYLSQLGYSVIDCDNIARQLSNNSNILEQVRQLLGECSIDNGQLNRPYIRSVVFEDSNLLAKYSAIFNSAIANQVLTAIDNASLVFVQLPVFSAVAYNWHRVWNVVCSDTVRINRTVARDNTSVDDVVAISNNQVVPVSTDTIDNSGSIAQLHEKIDALLAIL